VVDYFGSTTISIQDLQEGDVQDLLEDANVIVAVDTSTQQEEVVKGEDLLDEAVEAAQLEDLVVLRVKLDMESDELEWLIKAIESLGGREREEYGADEGHDSGAELDEE